LLPGTGHRHELYVHKGETCHDEDESTHEHTHARAHAHAHTHKHTHLD